MERLSPAGREQFVHSCGIAKIDGHRLCLVRTSEGVFALDQACPHEGYGLTTGELDGDLITCAWHNWKFRVNDGRCVLGEEDVRTYPVSVGDDWYTWMPRCELSRNSLLVMLMFAR